MMVLEGEQEESFFWLNNHAERESVWLSGRVREESVGKGGRPGAMGSEGERALPSGPELTTDK